MRSVSDETWSAPHIAPAIEACRSVCRARARNFYYGLKLGPEPQRSALYVLYAWMREADDLVDSHDHAPLHATESSIADFRNATVDALAGNPHRDRALWIALAAVADRFRLPHACFHSMLDGQVDDARSVRMKTFADLRQYCHRVASSVGVLCIELWGYTDDAAQELAIERGIAFQLTNILRDFKEDFDAGRIYLPADEFARFGLTPQALREWSDPSACAAMMQFQTQRARQFYERSGQLEQLINPQFRPTLWAMTSIYHQLLGKIERDPERAARGRRIRLSAWQKGWIALRARLARERSEKSTANPAAVAVARAAHGNTTAS